MTMTLKKRLWIGFAAGLLVLPPIFGIMLWAMGKTERLLDVQANLVQQIRLGAEVERSLERLGSEVGRAAVLQRDSVVVKARELADTARGTHNEADIARLLEKLDAPLTPAALESGAAGASVVEAGRAARIIVAHGDPRACARLGFTPAVDVEEALEKARDFLGDPKPHVAVMELPPPFWVRVR